MEREITVYLSVLLSLVVPILWVGLNIAARVRPPGCACRFCRTLNVFGSKEDRR